MLDKIKALPEKTLLWIGLSLQSIAILFIIVLGFMGKLSLSVWVDFIFYGLYFLGLPFVMLAYGKRKKRKQ